MKEEMEYDVKIQNPMRSSLLLRNNSNNTIEFKLKLNDKIFYSEHEIRYYIDRCINSVKSEPLYRKAWSFVMQHTYHHIALSAGQWLHSPLLFINSIGFGLCDDINTFLSNVWQICGYQSRVWHLKGHVVPEILSPEKWELYDADYGRYYITKNKQIASVQDILEDKSIINHQTNRNKLSNNLMSLFRLNDLIRSYFHNGSCHIEGWYNNYPVFSPGNFTITPGGYFQFPAFLKENIYVPKVGKLQNIMVAKLVIPKGYTGVISQPLQLVEVIGEGTFQFNVGKSNIRLNKSKYSNFLNEICNSCTIVNSRSDIAIFYFINPYIFRLEKQNFLRVTGSNYKSIGVEIKELENDQFFIYPDDLIDKIMTRNNDDLQVIIEDLINSKNFIDKMSMHLNGMDLSMQRKKHLLRQLKQFKKLFIHLSHNEKEILRIILDNKSATDLLMNCL